MIRSILLLAMIGATLGIYLEKRAQRAPTPPAPNVSPSVDRAGGETPTRSPRPAAASDETWPLSIDDRELLRFAQAEWGALPEGLLRERRPAEDRRRIAEAAFRRLLSVRSVDRFGVANRAPVVTRVELAAGSPVDLATVKQSGRTIEGESLKGLPVTLPPNDVRSRRELSENEALSAWDAEVRRRVTLLTEGRDPYEWTKAIELLLAREKREEAERLFENWVTLGGPAIVIDRALPTITERELITLTSAWDETEDETTPAVATTTTSREPGAPRTLTGLHAFLEDRQLRGLAEKERLAKIAECEEWESWLERQGGALSLRESEREGLTNRLQLLRYDLLKTSGF